MSTVEYEVKIKTWNLDEDSDDWGKMDVETRMFDDKDEAYRSARFWTEAFNFSLREGMKFQFKIEVTTIERSTMNYSAGAY